MILGGIFFPKSFLETVQQEAVTNFTCVPAALLLLLQYRFASQYDVSSLDVYKRQIWSLVSFSPYIPPQYLPEDNIFDLAHYWQQFLHLVQTRNAGVTGYDFYGNVAFSGIVIQWIVLPVTIFAFFACIWSIRKVVVGLRRKDAQEK